MSWDLAVVILAVVSNILLLLGPFKNLNTLRNIFLVVLVFNLMNLLSEPELYQLLGIR